MQVWKPCYCCILNCNASLLVERHQLIKQCLDQHHKYRWSPTPLTYPIIAANCWINTVLPNWHVKTPKCSKFDTSLQFGGNFCARWPNKPCFFLRIWQKWSQDLWLTCDQNEIWLKNPRLIHHLLSVSQTKLEIPEIKVIFLYIPCAEPRGTLHTLRGHSNVLTPSPHHPQHLHHLSCSSFRACLVFPPTVLQHDGSIWKCLLKGSGECLQERAKLLLDSKHWRIYSHADVQMDDSIHRYRRYSYNI